MLNAVVIQEAFGADDAFVFFINFESLRVRAMSAERCGQADETCHETLQGNSHNRIAGMQQITIFISL